MTDFVAVDGEGWTVGEEHRYGLLASSEAPYLWETAGLSTVSCFEYLLDLPRKSTKVAFGFNYDVNMMLRDVPLEQLVRLWKEGECRWSSYYMQWIPSKHFMVKAGKGSACKIFDVFGFFQSSFVKAIESWGFPPQPSMEEMKAERGTFTPQMRKALIEYCKQECATLVDLMDALEVALNDVDLPIKNWIGAGAIAASLMKKQGVKQHHQYDAEFGDEVNHAILSAYFGGRVELFQSGEFPTVYDYDISSAYPSVAIELPSLAHGDWVWKDKWDESPYALWNCEWELEQHTLLCPFPYRRNGAIHYPLKGTGWYHTNEVHAAKRLYGSAINIHGGWCFEVNADTVKPFRFIPKVYADRRDLKRKGHAGEKVLKLGLNSLYGKLAQGASHGDSLPPFQSFFWAGYITAGTRARVLEIASTNVDDLLMIATDGIFFKSDPHIPETEGLGGLELTMFSDVFIAQPGVYVATDPDGKTFGRSRGFFSKEINWDDIRAGFAEHGITYEGSYDSERFYGLGHMLMNRNVDKWRIWVKSERKLSLHPSRKFVVDYDAGSQIQMRPNAFYDGLPSEPYTPKLGFAKMEQSEVDGIVEHIMGLEQPMKEY